jgi:3-polyprenyl-4-hydroxybenzoate decarboxylase
MPEQDWRQRLNIGITGAPGAIYGGRLLQVCP